MDASVAELISGTKRSHPACSAQVTVYPSSSHMSIPILPAVHGPSVERIGAEWTRPGNLVSNGPFTLSERIPNDHIKLVKNPKFHDAGRVRLDRVVFYPTQDRSTAIKRFQAGELDSNDELPVEQLTELRMKFGDQVHVGPYLGVYYCFINVKKEHGAIRDYAARYPCLSIGNSWLKKCGVDS